jgi:hypothetical protein
MRGVWIHGGLLLVMAVAALSTTTRERFIRGDAAWGSFWQRDTADVVSVAYRSSRGEIELAHSLEDGEAFVWGREVLANSQTEELSFPVGQVGTELVDAFADFKVPRILGSISPEQTEDFGFGQLSGTLTIAFVDGARVLDVGDAVHGADDRYVRDQQSGEAFVISESLIEPLRIGSEALRERRLHHFVESNVARVRVEGLGSERDMLRADTGPGTPAIWLRGDGSGLRDQTFANFMERVAEVAIRGFRDPVEAGALERFLRIEYFDGDDGLLGFIELSQEFEGARYFVRSEQTRVHAETLGQGSAIVQQDLSAIF